MAIDDCLKLVDANISKIDEIEKLKSELKDWEEKAVNANNNTNKLKNNIFCQKNIEIKNAILEICKLKNIDYSETNHILHLSYKKILGFTVNLSNETRFISRTNEGKINLSMSLNYLMDAGIPKPSSTTIYSSQKEGIELQIDRCKQDIEYNEEVVKVLGTLDLGKIEIQIVFGKDKTIIVKNTNELISEMFK